MMLRWGLALGIFLVSMVPMSAPVQAQTVDDILSMEHDERHIWLREIARINREINEARKRG